jgi:hypothetical protein
MQPDGCIFVYGFDMHLLSRAEVTYNLSAQYFNTVKKTAVLNLQTLLSLTDHIARPD